MNQTESSMDKTVTKPVETKPKPKRSWRWFLSVGLWILAFIIMAASAVYQRKTGPTYPLSGVAQFNNQACQYEFIRSGTTGEDARVEFPYFDMDTVALLHFKRYKTGEEHIVVPMQPEGEGKSRKLVALLPSQPPAGKLEYYVTLHSAGDSINVPGDREVVIRFKGAVPAAVLIPHVLLMFIGMLFGMRTLLQALTGMPGLRWMAWTTFILIFIGGLILGPAVQKYAFGAAWTGVPFGWDLTDNKTLIMVVGWLIAICFVGMRGKVKPAGRWMTVLASLLMITVYLVPHSMYGSELDYSKVEQGVPVHEAIGQG